MIPSNPGHAMPFAMLYELFPKVAEQETRCVILPFDDSIFGLTEGRYAFCEMFCNEPGCDCRRVFLEVHREGSTKPLALISWGWETPAFYRKWLKHGDDNDVKELIGPMLPFNGPQTRVAEGLLSMARELLITNPEWVERVKRHYRMFREKIDGAAVPAPGAGSAKPGPGPFLRVLPPISLERSGAGAGLGDGRNFPKPPAERERFANARIKTRHVLQARGRMGARSPRQQRKRADQMLKDQPHLVAYLMNRLGGEVSSECFATALMIGMVCLDAVEAAGYKLPLLTEDMIVAADESFSLRMEKAASEFFTPAPGTDPFPEPRLYTIAREFLAIKGLLDDLSGTNRETVAMVFVMAEAIGRALHS